MREQEFARPVGLLSAGFVIWAAHFTAIYAINAVVCELASTAKLAGFPLSAVLVLGASALALVLLGLVALHAWRGGPHFREVHEDKTHAFLRFGTLAVAALATLAVLWQSLPALIGPGCT